MLSKRYESTEVDRRTWLHVPSGTHWSTSSDTHQVVEIQIETSTKQKRSTEGCSKFKSPETRQVQERLVSTLEHMQVPKWDRTRCPEE